MQIVHDVRHYANDHASQLFAGETPEEDIIARLVRNLSGHAPPATPALMFALSTLSTFRS